MQLIRWSLTPWLTRVEQAMSDLLPRGQYAKFNLDSLLRGDTLSRYQAHKIGIDAGFLTVDEVRHIEDKPAYLNENDDAEMIEAPETVDQTELLDMAGEYADD
jgi:phage portal protein BeeE